MSAISYYIFKLDSNTGAMMHICNGSHDTEEQCRIHWQAYMYGFMDAVMELTGTSLLTDGDHEHSFRVKQEETGKDLVYFMLLGQEGQDLVYKIANGQAL